MAEFGELNLKLVMRLTMFSIICGIGYSYTQLHNILGVCIIGIICISLFNYSYASLCYYIIASLYIGEIYPAWVEIAIVVLIGMSFFIKNIHMVYSLRGGSLLLGGISIIILSYLFGYQSDLNTALHMCVCIFIILMLLNSCEKCNDEGNIAICIWGYISRAISLVAYFAMQLINSGLDYRYGRLSFNGDIKIVSILVAIPLVLILSTKLEEKKLFKNLDLGNWSYIFIGLFGIILITTAARGVILALVIALFVQVCITKNKFNFMRKVVPVILFVGLFIYLNLDNSTIRLSRLFVSDEFITGNGRTEIWKSYLEKILSGGPIRWLFGVGPGNIARISDSGYYAHSTFLDFFFSYGILGFMFMFVCEIKIFRRLIKKGDKILITLFIALVVMYSTHGSAANISLYVLQTFILIKIYYARSEKKMNIYNVACDKSKI